MTSLLKRRLPLVLALHLAAVAGAATAKDYRGQDGWRMLDAALPFALKGNREAIHDCFLAGYLRASSPFLGGEDCEAIGSGLSQVLYRRGDRAFSTALAVERPEVIAAVKFWIGDSSGFYERRKGFKSFAMSDYPKSKRLLAAAPAVDFPLDETSPRRAALLKQLR